MTGTRICASEFYLFVHLAHASVEELRLDRLMNAVFDTIPLHMEEGNILFQRLRHILQLLCRLCQNIDRCIHLLHRSCGLLCGCCILFRDCRQIGDHVCHVCTGGIAVFCLLTDHTCCLSGTSDTIANLHSLNPSKALR